MSKLPDSISIVWGISDVIGRAEQNAYILTDQQAREILQEILRMHDANIGVTWDTLDFYISDYLLKTHYNHK